MRSGFQCAGDVADLDMRSVFVDSCAIRELGKAYRNACPAEDEFDILRDLNASGDVSINLDEIIGQDFAKGNTVQIQGWILSRTEARQYALFSLLAE